MLHKAKVELSTEFFIIYFSLLIPTGALMIWWSKRKISSIERERRSKIKTTRRFETIKTGSPISEPTRKAEDTALESVGHRFSIIKRLSFYTIITIWLLALVLPLFNNMPATLLSIIIAASGVIVGVAARPFIENLISGIVISFSEIIRTGDTVIVDGNYGYVEDITITHTIIKVWNWRRYIIPNARMLRKDFTNCTINDRYQWTHVEFQISYDIEPSLVKQVALEIASRCKYLASYEDPKFWIMEMKENGYVCWVAAWADSPSDAWELTNEIRTELVKRFKIEGVKPHSYEVSYSPQTEKTSFSIPAN